MARYARLPQSVIVTVVVLEIPIAYPHNTFHKIKSISMFFQFNRITWQIKSLIKGSGKKLLDGALVW